MRKNQVYAEEPIAFGSGSKQTKSKRAFLVVLVTVLVLLVGLAGAVVWLLQGFGATPSPEQSIERLRPAWESAVAKARVEAAFPAGPVDVTGVRVSGRQPLDATFTPEEISALMGIYRFETSFRGETVSVREVEFAFPAEGEASLAIVVSARDREYHAQAAGAASYAAGEIVSPGLTALSVEGLPVTGRLRELAGEGLVVYLNRYLDAVPGLHVEEARIVPGGIEVQGTVPQRVEHPAPIVP